MFISSDDTSLVAQLVRNPSAMVRSPGFNPWVGKILWRRKWQPNPVFLPGESHGQRSLVGYIVHRVTKSWTQLKRLSTHAHTLNNMGKSTLGNLPKITNPKTFMQKQLQMFITDKKETKSAATDK